MTTNKKFRLEPDQFLSHFAAELPTNAGLHLIVAPTGAGKTYHMLEHSRGNDGITCFPVKAIAHQKALIHDAKDLIVQLEKLSLNDVRDKDCLHVDECQILYTAGYRGSTIDNLYSVITEFALTKPVYLYTATADIELLPFTPTSTTEFIKPLNRKITVIQIDTKGNIKGQCKRVANVLLGIHETEPKPVLCFIESRERGTAVAEHLKQMGLNSIMLSSGSARDRDGKPDSAEHQQCYDTMLSAEKVSSSGYDVVLSTKFLAEGIDFHDDFHVVSLQCDPGLMFQQQGRARKKATHWMLIGSNDEKLWIGDDDSVLGVNSQIKTQIPEVTEKCKAYAQLDTKTHLGMFGTDVLHKFLGLVEGAYTWDEVILVDTEFTATVVKRESRKMMIAALQAGLDGGYQSAGFNVLLDSGLCDPVARVTYDKLEEFVQSFGQLQAQGVKATAAEFYRVTTSDSRTFIEQAYLRPELEEKTCQAVAAYSSEIETGKGGRVSSAWVDKYSEHFWEGLLSRAHDHKWWIDENAAQRKTMFKLLIGLVPDGDTGHWKLARDEAWWQVPLSRPEQVALAKRKPVIESAGGTVQGYCDATGKDRRELANTKPKELKQEVSVIDWGV